MSSAILTISSPGQADRSIKISASASIGRAADNSICIDDAKVSRYHAIIEVRSDGFWLTDLGSRNGTTVNGCSLTRDRKLADGDVISAGGTSTIEFHPDETGVLARGTEADMASDKADGTQSPEQTPFGFSNALLSTRTVVTAVVIGVAVTLVTALLLAGVPFGSRSGAGGVRIASPQNGSTIQGSMTVRLQAEKPRVIERVVFQLDGVDFASAEAPPFELTVSPAQLATRFPDLGRGNHILSVTVENRDGSKAQPESVLLAFDVGETNRRNKGADTEARMTVGDGGSATTGGTVDVQALAQGLASQISGKSGYVFGPEFAEQIRLRTADYRVDVIDKARRYRREVCRAFSNQGVPPLVGFVMAVSRSRFVEGDVVSVPAADSDRGIGLWRVPKAIAVAQGYLGSGESESALSDPKRSAEIAAAYMKYLDGLFGREDFIYAIACYGMPLNQVGEMRSRLEEVSDPATRRDFWRMVQSGVVPRDAADRVVRFFAAGIVGENPQAFGLKPEPLSSLC